jgi:hypothetical protein
MSGSRQAFVPNSNVNMSLEQSLLNLEIVLKLGLRAAKRYVIPPKTTTTRDVFLCLVDHFEPHVGRASDELAHVRMQDWMTRYPQISQRHQDADGCHPAHSFFYPYDEFDAWEFSQLTELCAQGWGEIDLHLHHRDDTSDSLREKFSTAIQLYNQAGVLTRWPDGRPAWGFIHGNWALDNSRLENGKNFCGVNNELTLLAEEGCYADFTFPAWQQTAQPRQINSIFYATDDPTQPKSYDTGVAVRCGGRASGTLLLIQGPLRVSLKFTRSGPRLSMDDGDLASYRRYTPARLDHWVETGIQVQGRPDRVFIKLHCHGAADANRAALLDQDLEAMFSDAESRYNDGKNYRLHYVTAREMYNIVKATEANSPLPISAVRDYILQRPPVFTSR